MQNSTVQGPKNGVKVFSQDTIDRSKEQGGFGSYRQRALVDPALREVCELGEGLLRLQNAHNRQVELCNHAATSQNKT